MGAKPAYYGPLVIGDCQTYANHEPRGWDRPLTKEATWLRFPRMNALTIICPFGAADRSRGEPMIIHYACSGKLKSGLIITYAASVCHAKRPFELADFHVIWFDFRDAKFVAG